MSTANLKYEHLGDYKFLKNQFQEAIKEYNVAIALNKNRAITWHHRGRAFMYNGNILEALSDFYTALKLKPNLPSVLVDIGRIMEFFKDYSKALEYYNAALQIIPQHLYALATKEQLLLNIYKCDLEYSHCYKYPKPVIEKHQKLLKKIFSLKNNFLILRCT
ncbi:MAG TPA: hypothetical protein VK172_00845 [Lentimicrobium sp.]|nr:hypothetical protein [Lentimicrobium sp.]